MTDSPAETRLRVIDSHTAGEPTRVLVDPLDLAGDTMTARARDFAARYDALRRDVTHEPRGSKIIVGAALTSPTQPNCVTGVVYFNNVGCLGMCGHGTIGLLATLHWLGRIDPGTHRIDTPAGVVTATLHDCRRVTIENVPSGLLRDDVSVAIDFRRQRLTVPGAIAWGGNWFFIADWTATPIDPAHLADLTAAATAIRHAIDNNAPTLPGGGCIDHIELTTHATGNDADARSFVLCPGGAYDRSPCGTGTSATLAVLAARGQLAPGQRWMQESVIGSRFEASYDETTSSPLTGPGAVVPRITGSAYITADSHLIHQPGDPFIAGRYTSEEPAG